jgi:amidase/6-aminohexanoate-cyclic-dimer hydrolase
VVSRSVRDSAVLLDLTQGAEPGSAYWPPVPADRYANEIERAPGKLRIGVLRRSPFGTPVDPECLAAVESAAKLCATLGHELQDIDPPADGPAVGALFGVLMPVGMATAFRARAKELGRDPGPDDLEPVNYAAWLGAQQIGAIDYETARQAAHAFGFRAEAAMHGLDVVLSPTTARLTWKTGVIHLDQDPAAFMKAVAGASDFTMPYNLSGQPAISLPLHLSANGLPVGVMFGGHYGDERTLLRLAAQIEQAAPWSGRLSPMLRDALA